MLADLDPEISAYLAKPAPRGRPPRALARLSGGGRLFYGFALGLVGVFVGVAAAEDPSFVVPVALASGLIVGLPLALIGRRMRRRDAALVREGRLVAASLVSREPTQVRRYGKLLGGQRLVFAGEDGQRFALALDDAWLTAHAPSPGIGDELPLLVRDGERMAVLVLAGQPRLVPADR